MKLSPAFLAYKLSSAFSVLAPENLPLSGTLELPVLYQTGSVATAHRVFLCTEEQIGSLSSLPEKSSSLFLLCIKELPEELLRFRSPLRAAYPLFFRSCRSFSGRTIPGRRS